MHFDEVLTELGEFGPYQRKVYFLLCFAVTFTAFHPLVSVFISATPEHRCELPSYSGFNGTDTFSNQSLEHDELVNFYIPDFENSSDKCQVYNNQSDLVTCSKYVYDKTYFKRTLVTQWNLVCDETYKTTLSTSIYYVGVLFGSFGFGILSDTIGRKKTLMISLLLQGVFGVAAAFAPEIYSFMVFRFFVAMAAMGQFMTSFVIGMELIGPSKRLIAGITIEYFWAIGYVFLTLIAYLIRDWQWIQLTISLPSFAFLCYWWFIPESARWLVAKDRLKEANEIIQQAAKFNNKEIAENILTREERKGSTERVLQIFKSPKLLVRCVVIFVNWMVIAMGYYGLSLNSGSIGGNIYVNFILGGLIEFPAYTVCFLCHLTGRKKLHVIGTMLGGVACLILIAIDYFLKDSDNVSETQFNAIVVTLNTIGKFGLTIGFAIIYLWSAELFPTTLRNTLMGFSSTLARIGAILAPFIIDIGKYVPPKYKIVIPAAIFGSLTCIGALLSIILPETTGYKLPETIEEAENFPHGRLNVTADNDERSETKM